VQAPESAPAVIDKDLLERSSEGGVVNVATNSPMYLAHQRKECVPCNYFYYKADGCRQGNLCQFCHLCPKGEIKKRKKEKIKLLKAQNEGNEDVLQ